MNILKIKNRSYDLTEKFLIMGILNLTPDSFSDGNSYNKMDKALFHVDEMMSHGVDIIDIGGESSRPGSLRVSVSEELSRIYEITSKIKERFDIPISIDTYRSQVAEEMLNLGVDIINDIYGLQKDPFIAELVAKHEAALVLMHMQGDPDNMQEKPKYTNIVQEISDFLHKQSCFAIKKGVLAESLILDVGIGFGKSLSDNLLLIKEAKRIANNYHSLLGISRKQFIGNILDLEPLQRDVGTASANVISYLNGVRIFRVHNVKATYQSLQIAKAISYGYLPK